MGNEDGEKFCREYDISEAGNFEGKNILNLIENKNYKEVLADSFYKDCLEKLLDYRKNRVRPLRDDKILASWNGLMIYALAYAGRVFGSARYVDMAKSAADFILKNMISAEGGILTRYRGGEARFNGVAEDYAFVVMGLIELYQASFEVKYLTEAYRLNQILIDNFYEDGALYHTGKDGEKLISRQRELYDGAIPSYNSVSIGNFVRLAHLCDDPGLINKAEGIVDFFGADIEAAPPYFSFALCGMMLLNGASRQIVVTGDESKELLDIINKTYQPFSTVCLADGALSGTVGFYKSFTDTDGKSAVYLCEGSHCEAPVYDPAKLKERLGIKNLV